jgi:hypothetical protein
MDIFRLGPAFSVLPSTSPPVVLRLLLHATGRKRQAKAHRGTAAQDSNRGIHLKLQCGAWGIVRYRFATKEDVYIINVWCSAFFCQGDGPYCQLRNNNLRREVSNFPLSFFFFFLFLCSVFLKFTHIAI